MNWKKKYTFISINDDTFYIFWDNNDFNTTSNFKNESGDLFPVNYMNLNDKPWYKYETVYIYSIDLNKPANHENTQTGGYYRRR